MHKLVTKYINVVAECRSTQGVNFTQNDTILCYMKINHSLINRVKLSKVKSNGVIHTLSNFVLKTEK